MLGDERPVGAEFGGQGPDLVLEQFAERLDQGEAVRFRQAADVVVRFDHGRRPLDGGAFDHVGIDRALGQEAGAAEAFGFPPERLDEQAADDFSLALRIGDAAEGGQEFLGRVDPDDVEVELGPEHLHQAVVLAFAEEAVVDEDAGQALAHGPVDDQGGDERIDAAAQAAENAPAAGGLADFGGFSFDERAHVPIGNQAGDFEEKIGQDLEAFLRVDDFGMELDAVEIALRILDHGRPGVAGPAGDVETGREFFDGIAVAHPDLFQVLEAGQKPAAAQDPERGEAVFALGGRGDLAAEEMGHELEAVADAEDRDAEAKSSGGAVGAPSS